MIENRFLTNHRILYIDNDLNNSKLMKHILEADGFTVSLASNGMKGLILAIVERPDLIQLDVEMLNLDSYQVARHLQQLKQIKNTPIVIIMNSASPKDKIFGAKTGQNHYIFKPVTAANITKQIASFL